MSHSNSKRNLYLALFLVVAVLGCGPKSPDSMLPKEYTATSGEEKETNLLNRRIAAEAFTQSVTDDYRIGPGDLLDVSVYEAADLSDTVRVNANGMVTYPLLGEVELGGLTAREAEQRLEELIEAKYVKDPHITVFVKEYRSKQVAVIGAVNKPGNYELLGKGRLLDALALAGGLKTDAGRVAYVAHQGQDGQVEIDLDQLLVKGDSQLNLPISMGDTIFIPEAGTYYVNGAFKKPGSFRLTDNITVSQAVQIAGGLATGAQDSDAKLIRYKDGNREIIPVDLEAIEKGAQKDIALQDQDVLYVGKNPIIALFQTIRVGLNFFPFHISGSAPE